MHVYKTNVKSYQIQVSVRCFVSECFGTLRLFLLYISTGTPHHKSSHKSRVAFQSSRKSKNCLLVFLDLPHRCFDEFKMK